MQNSVAHAVYLDAGQLYFDTCIVIIIITAGRAYLVVSCLLVVTSA